MRQINAFRTEIGEFSPLGPHPKPPEKIDFFSQFHPGGSKMANHSRMSDSGSVDRFGRQVQKTGKL